LERLKMSKHTKGTWLAIDRYVETKDKTICEVFGGNREDARLIAAAPELLEALKGALATIEDYLAYNHNGDPWTEDARLMGEMDVNDYKRDGRLDRARAAIAKATGEQA
jgi:hypothetical protein